MLIGVPLETAAGETRVAVTPETAKKLIAQGHTVRVQSGAGVAASATDAAYEAAGAQITDRAGALSAELVLKVKSPRSDADCDELGLMKSGSALVGMLNPFDTDNLARLAAAGIDHTELQAVSDIDEPADLVHLPARWQRQESDAKGKDNSER